MSALVVTSPFLPAEPLRKRAPAFDEHGKALSDFMVLFPGLVRKPQHYIQSTIEHIQKVFADHGQAVVFAELNLKLSLLWISVRSRAFASRSPKRCALPSPRRASSRIFDACPACGHLIPASNPAGQLLIVSIPTRPDDRRHAGQYSGAGWGC
jgi:hypothetical protein